MVVRSVSFRSRELIRRRVESSIMLRPMVSRPVCLGIKHPLGLTARFLLLSDSCGFVAVGRSLWRKHGSIIYSWCCPSPAQSFSGLCPVGLVTIFYCLRFETSFFVASYDSQGHGGGIYWRVVPIVEAQSENKTHLLTEFVKWASKNGSVEDVVCYCSSSFRSVISICSPSGDCLINRLINPGNLLIACRVPRIRDNIYLTKCFDRMRPSSGTNDRQTFITSQCITSVRVRREI
jgi:hypothetical protein